MHSRLYLCFYKTTVQISPVYFCLSKVIRNYSKIETLSPHPNHPLLANNIVTKYFWNKIIGKRKIANIAMIANDNKLKCQNSKQIHSRKGKKISQRRKYQNQRTLFASICFFR